MLLKALMHEIVPHEKNHAREDNRIFFEGLGLKKLAVRIFDTNSQSFDQTSSLSFTQQRSLIFSKYTFHMKMKRYFSAFAKKFLK